MLFLPLKRWGAHWSGLWNERALCCPYEITKWKQNTNQIIWIPLSSFLLPCCCCFKAALLLSLCCRCVVDEDDYIWIKGYKREFHVYHQITSSKTQISSYALGKWQNDQPIQAKSECNSNKMSKSISKHHHPLVGGVVDFTAYNTASEKELIGPSKCRLLTKVGRGVVFSVLFSNCTGNVPSRGSLNIYVSQLAEEQNHFPL